MGTRRDMLAVQTVVVSFLAAARSISAFEREPDIRVLLVEGARDRALQLLDQVSATLPYEPGSPLDHAISAGRERIERAEIPEAVGSRR